MIMIRHAVSKMNKVNLRYQAPARMWLIVLLMLDGAALAQDFKKQVIYQIVTDRFL